MTATWWALKPKLVEALTDAFDGGVFNKRVICGEGMWGVPLNSCNLVR